MDNCRIKYILKADLSQFLDFYTEFKFRYEEVYARLSDLIDKIPRNELMKQGYPSDLQQFDLVPIINNLFLDTIKELKEIFTPSNCLIKLIDKEKKETDDLFGDLSSYGIEENEIDYFSKILNDFSSEDYELKQDNFLEQNLQFQERKYSLHELYILIHFCEDFSKNILKYILSSDIVQNKTDDNVFLKLDEEGASFLILEKLNDLSYYFGNDYFDFKYILEMNNVLIPNKDFKSRILKDLTKRELIVEFEDYDNETFLGNITSAGINFIKKINLKNEYTMKKTKILFLSANPQMSGPVLRLDEEFRDVKQQVERIGKKRDEFILSMSGATRIRDLQQALLDDAPNILHFSGHGNEDGICLVADLEGYKIVQTEPLAEFFSYYSDKIQCIFLNSCYSSHQAFAISKSINYVIGMRKSVPDSTAIEFSIAFYQSIASGNDIEFSFAFAKNSIKLNNLTGDDIPVLLIK